MSKFQKFNFKNYRALVRVDFNVPLDQDFNILDDTRMVESLPTIQKILKNGGACIIITHFGRPKVNLQSVKLGSEYKFSTQHLVNHLSKLLSQEVKFVNDCGSEEAYKVAKNLKSKEVLLLENTRFYAEETQGDESFAQILSTLGDVYVNDAFGSSHRAHASTSIVAKYFEPKFKMFGLLMQKEVENADKIIKNPTSPLTAIIGGAKVSDKILILENLLNKADNIIIGGGMAYTFLKAKGAKIGNSLVEENKLELASNFLEIAKSKNINIYLPIDSIIADKFDKDAESELSNSFEIKDNWMALDIGNEAINEFEKVILDSKTIIWNGPMGVFEFEKFSLGTKAIARAVAKATENGAFSLVGGGDSISAINKFQLKDKISFISTGGGALLEYFEGKILPGIAAITENNVE